MTPQMMPWEYDVLADIRDPQLRKRAENGKVRRGLPQQRLAGRNNYKKYGHPIWYGEYLKTEHWQKFKERYKCSGLPRHCIICGESRYELHHITYERIGEERLLDVVALCRRHHARAHKREKEGESLRTAHLE